MASAPDRRKHRPLLTLFLLLVLLGAGGVVIQRWVAPPATFLMVSRAIEGEGVVDHALRLVHRFALHLEPAEHGGGLGGEVCSRLSHQM